MRELKVSSKVRGQISDVLKHLDVELKMSQQGILKFEVRMNRFLGSLQNDADYALCRFEEWRKLGYRCTVFEKDWIFAYEIYPAGVIIREMCNAALLKK